MTRRGPHRWEACRVLLLILYAPFLKKSSILFIFYGYDFWLAFDFLWNSKKIKVRLPTHPTYPAHFVRHPSFKGRHRRFHRLKTVLHKWHIEGKEAQVASQPLKCTIQPTYRGKVCEFMLFSDAKIPNSYILTPNYITPTAGSEASLSTLQAPH